MSNSQLHTKIRKIHKNELLQIFELDKEAFSPNHYPLFVLRQLYDIFPDLFLVAVDQHDKILGYCFGGKKDDQSNSAWIFALAIIKSAQQQKVGQKLTSAIIDTFKAKNINKIYLTTTPDNIAALRLYTSLGFVKIMYDSNYYLDHSPRILMQLKS